MTHPARIALALAAAIFLAAWFAASVLRWMPSIQFAVCAGGRGALCTAGTLLFAYVYYAALTVPVTAALLAWGITHLLGRGRPVALALGVLLLAVGALFQAIGVGLELGVRLTSGQWTAASLVNSALAPLLALGGLAAAWLLWQGREGGRRLAIAVLAITIASTLWTAWQYPQAILRSPLVMLALLLRMALLAYLLAPPGRAATAAPR